MKAETEIAARPGRTFWIVLSVLAMSALVLAFLADPIVAMWLKENTSRGLRNVMSMVSRVGDWPAHVALGLLLLALAWWRGSKKWMRVFVAMLLAMALAGAVVRVIKITTGRARPTVHAEHAWNGVRLASKYHSFPSGHTAASTAFFFTLFLARRRLGGLLLIVPAVIALSRMVVGAHYLSDVTFAAIVGIACAMVADGGLRRWWKAPC
ncbi:MAG: phosphatase PAP2 family protein [Verrucomicrobiota bacterium]|nr:phosphatase PAP2 family protein [Verrucomicrobiota bacterium]